MATKLWDDGRPPHPTPPPLITNDYGERLYRLDMYIERIVGAAAQCFTRAKEVVCR